MRRLPALLGGLGLVALAAGAVSVAISLGCRVVESTADALADATAGTAVGGAFRSVARAAESMRDYSPAEEHYIGRSVAAQILTRYHVHPDSELEEYVNLVGLAVLAAPEAKRTLTGYHFAVLVGDEVQAVSAPGGFVFVTEGAVRRARDEDELAALLAHEIAHVSLGHGIQSIQAATRQKSFELGLGAAAEGAGEYAAARGDARAEQIAALADVFDDCIAEITDELLVRGYSRESELEADATALSYLRSSGYARAALPAYLRALQAGGVAGSGGWGTTHPPPKDRIDALASLDLGAVDAVGRDVRKARFIATLGG